MPKIPTTKDLRPPSLKGVHPPSLKGARMPPLREARDAPIPSTKDARLEIRISEEEKERFQRAADQDGRPLSNWIRDRLNRAARAELGSIEAPAAPKGR